MVTIHPFAAYRPDSTVAQFLAAVPYDVVTAEEARTCIEKNPLSFLRVSRADAELPALSPQDPRIYDRARATFQNLIDGHMMVRDDSSSLYVYRVQSDERTFTGLIACVEADDYLSGLIRKHELTQYEKEEDRTRHIDVVNAQTGMVFLVYRDPAKLSSAVEAQISGGLQPVSEIVNRNGARHQVFRVKDPCIIARLQDQFKEVQPLYIADGHHRAAAAVNVALKRQGDGTATPESLRFMAVLFAHHQVMIHGYSRLITDLGDLSGTAFLEKISYEFDIRACRGSVFSEAGESFCMYLLKQWYELTPHHRDASPIAALDVTILQERILRPILGIIDPRKDSRLHYYGGVHSFHDLEKMVDSHQFAVAFALRPVSIETVMTIADAQGIMPPKSTWFEPKLLSGLLVHTLD
jgi:uncharacterized protein (DUF1015 family)